MKHLQFCASGRTANGISCHCTYCIAIYCLFNDDSSTSAVRISQGKRRFWRRRGGLFDDNTVRDWGKLGIIQERELQKAVLGNYCRGVRRIRRKWGTFCAMLGHRKNGSAVRSWVIRTVKQLSVRMAANKDGGAVRRTGSSSSRRCARCRYNKRVFFKTAIHEVSFLRHLNCSLLGKKWEKWLCPQSMSDRPQRKRHAQRALQRDKCGALGDQSPSI
jgi:hypothetical protein